MSISALISDDGLVDWVQFDGGSGRISASGSRFMQRTLGIRVRRTGNDHRKALESIGSPMSRSARGHHFSKFWEFHLPSLSAQRGIYWVFVRSAFYVLCVLDPLRSMSVCVCVCTDFFGKLPRGSKGVTALWPRGVLNEMNEILKNHCFWTSFKHDLGTVNRD